jgi:hypothetical protein
MRSLIAVPWRGGAADRERNWAFARPHYEGLGIDIVELDSGHEPFNRGFSQSLAGELPWDVVAILDADIIVPTANLLAAFEEAHQHGCVVKPADRLSSLDEKATLAYMDGKLPSSMTNRKKPAGGGLHVVGRRAWDLIGGYDGTVAPRGQDTRFTERAAALNIPIHVLRGQMLHLNHERPDKVYAITAFRKAVRAYSGNPNLKLGSRDWTKAAWAYSRSTQPTRGGTIK